MRTIIDVTYLDDGILRTFRYNCAGYDVNASGALIIYDAGIIAAYAAGQWLRVRVVSQEEIDEAQSA